MADNEPSKINRLLDMLLDALQERQAERGAEQPAIQTPQAEAGPVGDMPEPIPALLPAAGQDESPGVERVAGPEIDVAGGDVRIAPAGPEADVAGDNAIDAPDVPEALPAIYLDRMLGRLAIFLLVLTVVVNIPYSRYGTNLARAMPDVRALVIRDGLVLKGEGEEIYVLEDNHKRWISSLDAFAYYGFTWEQVNHVDDDFLDQFPSGPPLSLVYKCDGSPHIYAIENGVKRWIKDIPTFEAQGYVWEDVQIVPCRTIDDIPSGPPIPPNAGEPPPP
jgi:hypothetical protein